MDVMRSYIVIWSNVITELDINVMLRIVSKKHKLWSEKDNGRMFYNQARISPRNI